MPSSGYEGPVTFPLETEKGDSRADLMQRRGKRRILNFPLIWHILGKKKTKPPPKNRCNYYCKLLKPAYFRFSGQACCPVEQRCHLAFSARSARGSQPGGKGGRRRRNGMFPLETIVKASRKFLGLIVLGTCSADPNVSAPFRLLLRSKQEPCRKCSAAWWRSQVELDFREQLMK